MINLATFLAPRAGNTYYLLEDIHIRGGYQAVPTEADRLVIDESKLKDGLMVWVVESKKLYRYENADWVEASLQGAPGTKIYASTLDPTLPNTGTTYSYAINYDTGDFFSFSENVWTKVGSLKGPAGAAGEAGKDGLPGADGKDGVNGVDGKDGTNGVDGLPGAAGKDGVNGVDGLPGKDGKSGSQWLISPGLPNNSSAAPSGSYTHALNSVNGDIYLASADAWVVVGNLNGDDGSKWVLSNGEPDPLAEGYSYALNTATGDIYTYTNGQVVNHVLKNGTWVLSGNIRGPQGNAGKDGTNGVDGKDGVDGTNGTSLTPRGTWAGDTVYNPGDYTFFTNVSGAAIYALLDQVPYSSTVTPDLDVTHWAQFFVASGKDGVNGAPGADGSVWRAGSGAPIAALGETKDFYVDSLTFDYYEKSSGSWTLIGNLRGKDGTNGADGKDGSTIYSASIDPVNSFGANNDYFLNYATGNLFEKVSGSWELVVSLIGKDGKDGVNGVDGLPGTNGVDGLPGKDGTNGVDGLPGEKGADGLPGEKGADGKDGTNGVDGLPGKDGADGKDGVNGIDGKDGLNGSRIYFGNEIDELVGVQDDYLFVQATGNLYSKSTGAWQLIGSLKGADGTNGVDGLPGKDGADGLPGTNGVDGLPGAAGKDGTNGVDGLPGADGKDGTNGVDGLPGEKGADGLPGAAGKDGISGSLIYFGSAAPQEVTGSDNDYYLNSTTGDFYSKSEGTWGVISSLIGPAGKDGVNGADGKDGINGVDGLPGKDGTNGVDGLPGADGKDGLPGEKGADGVNGVDGLPGKDGADGLPGKDGVNGVDGLPGEKGADGINGVDGLPGEKGVDGLPGEKGADGLPGEKGADGLPGKDGVDGLPGADGAPGAPGADGSVWHYGIVTPSEVAGTVKDFYLNTVTGDVYSKATGSWEVTGNIKGEKGADGINGVDGLPGAAGKDGVDGLPGEKGADGINGVDGLPGEKGVDGLPGEKGADGLPGKDGTNGVDGLPGADGLPGKDGLPGEKGADGINGAKWYSGSVVPDVAIGLNTDFYLRTDTGDVYSKATGSWVVESNLKGEKGDTGFFDPAAITLNLPYDIGLFISGTFSGQGVLVASFLAARDISLKAGIPGSLAVAKTPSANNAVLPIKANGVDVGTLTFNFSNVGSFEWLADVKLLAGQMLDIYSPATLETAIQDIRIVIVGAAAAPNQTLIP